MQLRRTLAPLAALVTLSLLSLVSLVSLLSVLSESAAAQWRYAVGAFVARDDALPGEPVVLGGGSFTSFVGPFGLRLSGGAHATWTTRYEYNGNVHRLGLGAWTADADLVVSPFRLSHVMTSMLGGFQPYGFVGIGGHGVNLRDRPDTSFATWSVGAGVDRMIGGQVGLQADARYRYDLHARPYDALIPPRGGTQWEYRAGLTVNFGRTSRPRSRYRPPVRRPVPRHTVILPDPSDDTRDTRDSRDSRDSRDADRAPLSGSAATRRLMLTAERYVGKSYRYGGASPEEGFDCSGFVQYVFASEGITLPRVSREMATVGEAVSTSELRPGDLVFYANDHRHIDHVAIYAGRNRILHSTASGGGVRFDDLDTERGEWFEDHMVTARRVIGAAGVERSARGSLRSSATDDTDFDPPDRAPAPRNPQR